MNSLANRLLIAAPELQDPNFHQTVALMIQHNDEGAMGLVLNRPSDMTMDDVWQQLYDEECPRGEPLHIGGPCEGPLMLLHGCEAQADAELVDGLCFTTEAESVKWLIEEYDGPLKCIAGYAGWGPGQLESELAEGSWVIGEADFEGVMRLHDYDLWDRSLLVLMMRQHYRGFHPDLIPRDPSHN